MKATTEHLELAKPGQFVFANNESEEAIGFIDFVSDCEICIMLFDPTETLNEDQIHISEECDWPARLKEIVDGDPEIRDMWMEVL